MITELRQPADVLATVHVTGLPESGESLAPGDLIISLNGRDHVTELAGLLGKPQ